MKNAFRHNFWQWTTFNFDRPVATTVGVSELIVRVSALGGTERIMIDDFSFDVAPSVCANPNVFFQTKNSGNWTNRGTWETSTSAGGPWNDAQCAPDTDAQEIVIRNGHTVTVSSDIDFDELIIENGGKLLHTAGIIDINNAADADFTIENGGVYELDGGSAPNFSASALLQVQTGGIVRITQNQSGLSGDLAGEQSSGKVEYQNGAIFDWNNNLSFLSSNQTYFPDAPSGVIPIFRVSQGTVSVGAGSPTTFNGLFEANAGVFWQNSGTKTFRNGIIGSGNVTMNSSNCGPFRITENGVIGGTGVLFLNNNDLEIASGATVTLTSNKTINASGSSTPDISINGILDDGGFSILGNYASVTVGSGAEVDVFNENGIVALNGTFTTTASISFGLGSIADYQRLGSQNVSGIAYSDLIIRGSGIKTCEGAISCRGVSISEPISLASNTGASLSVQHHFVVLSPANFDNTAYDELTLNMVSTIDADVNSWTNVRCLNFDVSTTNNVDLIGSFGQLEVKNRLETDLSGGGIFSDNGKSLLVGGDVILEGGTANFNLSGLLRLTGEQSSQSLQASDPNSEVLAEINALLVDGLTNPPNVDIPTDIGLRIKTDITINEGVVSMGQGVLTLDGNWTNYDQAGFNEGISRIRLNGTGFQDISCPGGEVFSSVTVSNINPSAGIRLNDNLSITGISSNILDLFSGSVIDLRDNALVLNGSNGNNPGTNIRVNNGNCSIISTNPSPETRVNIQNGRKTVISLGGGTLEIGPAITVRLESGVDCGAPDITTVFGTLEIANGGFVQTNPPVYGGNATLLYTASTTEVSPYFKGNEWNSIIPNSQGYPNNVEVRGSYVEMNIGTPHAVRGNLLLTENGTLDMGNNGVSGSLTIRGNVDIGPSSTPGNLTLGNNFGGDLFVEGSFRLFSGNFNPNEREVIMTGGNPSGSTILGNITFDYLAIDFPGGTVEAFQNITIDNRLRLSDGTFDLPSAVSLRMADNSKVLRELSSATVTENPVVEGLNQYDIEYTSSMSTGNEFTPIATSVDELFLNGIAGPITLTLSDNRTFNGDLVLNNATLNLAGNVLTAAENVPGSSAFDAEIIVDGTDTCRVTGPVNSVFQVTGNGGILPDFRTKQVVSLNNTKLLFEENVLVRIGNGGFDFGTGNPTKIDGILEVSGGGYAINNSCYYGNESLLRFSNGFDYQVDAIDVTWDAGDIASGNPGIPYNVESSGDANTDLTLNSPRSLRNDLTIIGSQFTLTTNSGTFEIGGDWIRSGATSAFNPNQQEVIFNGLNPQTITTFNGVASEVFYKLTFANTGAKTLQEDVTVLDSLKIETNGNLNLNSQTLFLGGNWNNLAGAAAFTETGAVRMIGDSTQTISCPGGEVFDELIIENSSELSEGIVMKEDMRVEGNLILNSGIIHPETVEELILGLNATNSGGDFRSYVNGVVRKDGFASTAIYQFPVGYLLVNGPNDTTSVWQPAAIQPQSASTSLNFDVRYFHENAVPGTNYPSNPPNVDAFLETASTCNYWDINRTGASVPAQIRLFWNDSTTCFNITNPALLRVARYSGSLWEDRGAVTNSSISPFTSGYVQSDWVNTFSPFAIGTTTNTNILPISLLSFTAEVVRGDVLTRWKTATEVNSDFFTNERAKDGVFWEAIGTIDGAGNSTEERSYAFTDREPYTGISYYRLRQTDFDGTTEVFDPRAVEINPDGTFDLEKVYPSVDGLALVYRSTAPYLVVEIYNMLGQRVHGELIENGGNGFNIIHPGLARGAYVLRLSHGSEMDSEKFVY
jgi:hypothetical protein